jgi:hypothetical protein
MCLPDEHIAVPHEVLNDRDNSNGAARISPEALVDSQQSGATNKS